MSTTTGLKHPEEYAYGEIIFAPHETDKNKNKIYKVVKSKDEIKEFKTIGNFYLDVVAHGKHNNKPIYLIDLNGKYTVSHLNFTSSLQQFKDFIRPFTFHGTVQDIEIITELILENVRIKHNDEDNLIIIRDFVGFHSSESISFWIFEDRIILTVFEGQKLAEPRQIMMPKDGIIRLNDYFISIEQNNINRALVPMYVDPEDYTLDQFLDEWLLQLKNKTLLYSLLGWFIASMNLQKVNKLRRCRFFPFYVVTASTEAGKTTLLSNCIKVFGLDYIGENFAASVTKFVDTIEFARVSHIPIWRDEYKNEKYALEKEGFLRSVFTRSSASRGTTKQDTIQYPPKATLLLSGEDITEDPALSRRMIKMRLKNKDKIDKLTFDRISITASQNFAKAFPLLIQQFFDDDVFLKIFNNPANILSNDTALRDELMCYACLGAIFGEDVADEAIAEARQYHSDSKNEIMNEKIATVDDFFNNLHALFVEKGMYESQFNNKPKVLDYFHITKKGEQKMVYIQFNSLYPLSVKNRQRDEYKWSKKAIGQLITEAYGAVSEPRKVGNQSSRVLIVHDYDQYTDALGDLLTNIEISAEAWAKTKTPFDDL